MVYTPAAPGVQRAPPDVVKVPVVLVSTAAPVGVPAVFLGIAVVVPIPRVEENTPPLAINIALSPVGAPV
jgi:hypothetical protein